MSDQLAWGFVRAGNQNTADAYDAVSEANATIRRLNARALGAEAEVARLRDMLAISQCEVAALSAQRAAFKTKHPTSPLLADSGKRFKVDGTAKTFLRLVYEDAFDKKAAELKISNPAGRRVD